MQRSLFILKSHAARPGGLEKYTQRLIRAFQKEGCAVTLVTSGEARDSALSTLLLPHMSKLSFLKLLQFDKFCQNAVREKKPDLVFSLDRTQKQTHLRAGNGVHAAYLEKRGQVDPLFKRLSYAINPLHRTLLSLEKRAFEHADLQAIFTNSSMCKEEILRYYNVDPHKIFVVHNGVEWEEREKDFQLWEQEKIHFAAELKIDPSKPQLLFIGHNFRRKGLDQLLRALARIPRAFHLSVVGDDKNRKEFENLAHTLGLQNKVTFFGSRTDTLRFYELADLLIIPSLYDPFANVTVEALAMGVFVVSSTTNGGHEVLTEKSGCTFEMSSLDALTETLTACLSKRKTAKSAIEIRNSVKHLDFNEKLKEITRRCLY